MNARASLLVAVLCPVLAYAQQSGGLPALQTKLAAEIAQRNAQNAALRRRVAALEAQVAELKSMLASARSGNELATALVPYVTVEPGDLNHVKGPHILFTGVNVHVRSGQGATMPSEQGQLVAPDGLGNLIIGWNEDLANHPWTRQGSNNLVIGRGHEFTSFGCLVAGDQNRVLAPAASITGGAENTVTGVEGSIAGGWLNEVSGQQASVVGGTINRASYFRSSVSGGMANEASGVASSVCGGWGNSASAAAASVTGGYGNGAAAGYSSVSGGKGLIVTEEYGFAP